MLSYSARVTRGNTALGAYDQCVPGGGENGTEVGRPAATTDFACVQRHGACDCAVTPARRFWRTRHAKPPRRATYATARTATAPSHCLSHVTEQAFACGLRIMHYNVCARECTQ